MGWCDGGEVSSTDEQLQQADAASTTQLTNDYATTFAENQSLLGQQTAKLSYIASNPMGYTPQQLHTATTAINENTATAAKQALGSAAAYADAHGGADVGGGTVGEVAGQIMSGAAQSKAQQLASLSNSNQELKQKNFWNAISGLNSVGSELGGEGGTAIGGATGLSNASVNAGSGALAAQQAGWSDFGSVLSGIGGLVDAGTGLIDANPKGIFS